MREYYAARAREYDAIYQKPERQADLGKLRQLLPSMLHGTTLLEVACGTGYWTQWLAARCALIVSQDISLEVLQVAAFRLDAADNTALICEDAMSLASLSRQFDAAFAGFWYSHLRIDQATDFLNNLHSRLLPGSRVIMLDNRYVEGSSTPLSRTDIDGNTWQLRSLASGGEQYEILKNFPSAESFEQQLPAGVQDVEFVELPHYWYASYTLCA